MRHNVSKATIEMQSVPRRDNARTENNAATIMFEHCLNRFLEADQN